MAARPLAQLAAELAGYRVPGGCDDCDAWQTLTNEGPGIYRLTVHHDSTCPAWRAKR